MTDARPPADGGPPVLVRNYYGRSQEDAAVDYELDAADLDEDGYEPISQSWAPGRSGWGRIIMLGFIGALAFPPDGTLTVTYSRRRRRRR